MKFKANKLQINHANYNKLKDIWMNFHERIVEVIVMLEMHRKNNCVFVQFDATVQ